MEKGPIKTYDGKISPPSKKLKQSMEALIIILNYLQKDTGFQKMKFILL